MDSNLPRTIDEIFEEVHQERNNQDTKWGVQDHLPGRWLEILTEELGEVAKNGLEAYPMGPPLRDRLGALEDWRAELIQVAAVAVAAIECFERNKVTL
jgi:hypothetical protein